MLRDRVTFDMVDALHAHLLSPLSSLPGSRRFHLHSLLSVPRKHHDLFPYTDPQKKCFIQDILVLVSEQSPNSRPIFVSAIEACLFTIPFSSTTLLYISKVDSTGQGIAPSPTQALVKALLLFYVNPSNRTTQHFWIHLFARAQNQYLFPNSVEHPGKRVLSDTQLCRWWKRILGQVVHQFLSTSPQGTQFGDPRAFYVLPGMSELEALQVLKSGSNFVDPISWTYGHPYSQPDRIMPSGVTDSRFIGDLIPFFPDDPKSRFLDELFAPKRAQQPPASPKKRAKQLDGTLSDGSAKEIKASKENDDLGLSISSDEFWEMMSFRQECSSGAITGFFVVSFTFPPQSPSLPITVRPSEGEVSKHIIERTVSNLLTSHEFSNDERSIASTASIESSIKSLCEGLKSHTEAGAATHPPSESPASEASPLDFYHNHVYSTVEVNNTPVEPSAGTKRALEGEAAPTVNVLAVKRKKKK